MNNDKYPFAPPEPGESPAPRRRRRRSGGNRGPRNTPAAPNHAKQRSAAQPAPPEHSKQRPPAAPEAPRGERRGAQQNSTTRRPQRPEPPQTPRPRTARSQPAVEEDPGLPLITRRPPKQKFANFEEYIAAHGGVTAPLPEETE